LVLKDTHQVNIQVLRGKCQVLDCHALWAESNRSVHDVAYNVSACPRHSYAENADVTAVADLAEAAKIADDKAIDAFADAKTASDTTVGARVDAERADDATAGLATDLLVAKVADDNVDAKTANRWSCKRATLYS
jgi:hypothetical protein